MKLHQINVIDFGYNFVFSLITYKCVLLKDVSYEFTLSWIIKFKVGYEKTCTLRYTETDDI